MKITTRMKPLRLLSFVKKIAVPLLACGVLASCASLIGPRQIEVPLTKLQAGLDRRFPVNNRVLELFDIELTRPQLAILEGSDRIALTMEASVAPPFIRQSWRGRMALSGRLYVDAARGAVFMGEPRVDRFAIDGVDDTRQLTKVANVLMDKVVRDMPVYTFRTEELRYAGVQFVPTRISTTPGALLVTVEPAR
jgi:hypothetical protein